MQVSHISTDRHTEWNAFVAQHPSFGLLQSWEWGEYKKTLGWQAYRIAIEKQGIGAQVLIKPAIHNLTSVAYIPRGPLVD